MGELYHDSPFIGSCTPVVDGDRAVVGAERDQASGELHPRAALQETNVVVEGE